MSMPYEALPCQHCRLPFLPHGRYIIDNEGDRYYLFENGNDSMPIDSCPWCGRKLEGEP